MAGDSLSYPLDPLLLEQLAAVEPGSVCSRLGCRWEAGEASYRVQFWGGEYRIDLDRKRVSCDGPDPAGSPELLGIFLVNCLLQASGAVAGTDWISEKDLAGGTGFFRGPHRLPTELITDRFANDLGAFGERCRQLGGSRLDLADCSFAFRAAPWSAFAVLYWRGDDDFPPESRILYDRGSVTSLALDTIYAWGVEICRRLTKS